MKGKALVLFVFVGLALAQWGGVSDGSYTYYDPLELYARVTKDYYLTTPNPVPADYLIDVKPVDKPHGSGIDSKKFHNDVGVVGLPSDVIHEFEESAPRELVISIDSLLDSISLQLAYEGGSSVELSSAHGSIRFYTSSDEILYLDYVDGNVGIGTMSPLYKLDVVGVARFSDSVKVGEYWLPEEIGTTYQILIVDTTGKLTWMNVKKAYLKDLTSCCSYDGYNGACEPWILYDNVVFTADWNESGQCELAFFGIAKGAANNELYGIRRTHNNIGVSCTTGTPGSNTEYCTITGGYRNVDSSSYGFIGGGAFNVLAYDNGTLYGVICGGDSNKVVGKYSAVCAGHRNHAGNGLEGDSAAFVGGGIRNFAKTQFSAVLGGHDNNATGSAAMVGAGKYNTVDQGTCSVICGGKGNNIIGMGYPSYSIIGSGISNRIEERNSGILSGKDNIIVGSYSVIGSGMNNKIESKNSGILAGDNNIIISDIYHPSYNSFIGAGSEDSIRGRYSGIVSGIGNLVGDENIDTCSFIGSGIGNKIYVSLAVISGGYKNIDSSLYSMIGCGENNVTGVCTDHSFIGGGENNIIHYGSHHATICGGEDNIVKSYWGSALSGYKIKSGDNFRKDTAVVVCGGFMNIAYEKFDAICGGYINSLWSPYSFVGGGYGNAIDGEKSGICCGYVNYMSNSDHCFIGGGLLNRIVNSSYSGIVDGDSNSIEISDYSGILGGKADTIENSPYSGIVGGKLNIIKENSPYSTIIGGSGNTINGAQYSAAFGEDVTVSNPYNTVFYNVEYRGKVGICEETPHSSLHDHGSFAVNVSIVSDAAYTATDTDMVILCETSTVPSMITINLPSVSTCEGRIYIIKKITNDTKTITIDPAGTETIDDMPTYTLSAYNQRVQIVATSRGWKIIN